MILKGLRDTSYICFILFSFLYAQRMIGQSVLNQILPLIFALILYISSNNGFSRKVYTFLFLIILLRLLNTIFLGELMPGTWMHIITLILLLYSFQKVNDYALLIPWIAYVFYVIYRITIVINPEFIFINSRNYVSLYAIFLIAPYYVKYIPKRNTKVFLIPAIINLMLSLYSLGRSGIFASILILLACILKNYSFSYVKLIVSISSLAFISLISLTFSPMDLNQLERIKSLRDGGRENILNEINDLSLIEKLIGFEQNKIPSVKELGHLHSSWLNFGSSIGILPMIILLGLIFYKGFKWSRISGTFYPLFLIIGICLRASTDIGLLFSPFDFSIFSILTFKGE